MTGAAYLLQNLQRELVFPRERQTMMSEVLACVRLRFINKNI